mgnify:CR=1 FL=1
MSHELATPMRAPGVNCEHCHEPIEAWAIDGDGLKQWRHVHDQSSQCVVTRTYACRPL